MIGRFTSLRSYLVMKNLVVGPHPHSQGYTSNGKENLQQSLETSGSQVGRIISLGAILRGKGEQNKGGKKLNHNH